MSDQEVVAEAERAERQRRVEDAVHSNEMEGLHVNGDTWPMPRSMSRAASTPMSWWRGYAPATAWPDPRAGLAVPDA